MKCAMMGDIWFHGPHLSNSLSVLDLKYVQEWLLPLNPLFWVWPPISQLLCWHFCLWQLSPATLFPRTIFGLLSRSAQQLGGWIAGSVSEFTPAGVDQAERTDCASPVPSRTQPDVFYCRQSHSDSKKHTFHIFTCLRWDVSYNWFVWL